MNNKCIWCEVGDLRDGARVLIDYCTEQCRRLGEGKEEVSV